mmetsp:Transcript_12095/g.32044  ORF Transcript_12095/g.32044 Transcript_12095/m.32044 type:complete len:527 (+) Transcript_12095:284-1864(+)
MRLEAVGTVTKRTRECLRDLVSLFRVHRNILAEFEVFVQVRHNFWPKERIRLLRLARLRLESLHHAAVRLQHSNAEIVGVLRDVLVILRLARRELPVPRWRSTHHRGRCEDGKRVRQILLVVGANRKSNFPKAREHSRLDASMQIRGSQIFQQHEHNLVAEWQNLVLHGSAYVTNHANRDSANVFVANVLKTRVNVHEQVRKVLLELRPDDRRERSNREHALLVYGRLALVITIHCGGLRSVKQALRGQLQHLQERRHDVVSKLLQINDRVVLLCQPRHNHLQRAAEQPLHLHVTLRLHLCRDVGLQRYRCATLRSLHPLGNLIQLLQNHRHELRDDGQLVVRGAAHHLIERLVRRNAQLRRLLAGVGSRTRLKQCGDDHLVVRRKRAGGLIAVVAEAGREVRQSAAHALRDVGPIDGALEQRVHDAWQVLGINDAARRAVRATSWRTRCGRRAGGTRGIARRVVQQLFRIGIVVRPVQQLAYARNRPRCGVLDVVVRVRLERGEKEVEAHRHERLEFLASRPLED